jgi:hypothetical protein
LGIRSERRYLNLNSLGHFVPFDAAKPHQMASPLLSEFTVDLGQNSWNLHGRFTKSLAPDDEHLTGGTP